MNSKVKYGLVRCIIRELIIVVLYHPAKNLLLYCSAIPNSGSQIFLLKKKKKKLQIFVTNCT